MYNFRVVLILCCCFLIANVVNAQIAGELTIANPGFEDGDFTGWQFWPTSDTHQSVTDEAAHNGVYSAKVVGATVAVYQTVPDPAVGHLYLVEGFAMNPSTDPIAADQEFRMEITFFDSNWGTLLQNFSDPMTIETTMDEWQTMFVTGICPEGAVNMNVGFNWVGTGDAETPGSAYGDDMRAFKLRAAPAIWENLSFEEDELLWDPTQEDWENWWCWAYEPLNIPAEIVSDYSHTGNNSALLRPQDWINWGDPWGWGGYWGNVGQSISVETDAVQIVEGDIFYMSVWVMTPFDNQLLGNATAYIEMQFKIEETNERLLQVFSAGDINEFSEADAWQYLEAYGFMPAGGDKVDLSVTIGQEDEAEGIVLIDDAFIATGSALEPPPEEINENEQLVNNGFGSDEAWTVYQLTDAAVATADFNYTDDGPAVGAGPALNLTGDVDAHVLVFQEVELIAGATYAIDGGFKDVSGVNLDCNWCQIYVSTEVPVEEQDYNPLDGSDSDRYLGFESWADDGAYSGAGVDGTFAEDAFYYGEDNIFIAEGEDWESVTYYYAMKVGSCGPAFNQLFDNLSLVIIDLPFPDETEMIVNGAFGSDANWTTMKLTGADPDASYDFNYTDDGPAAGEGPALRFSGDLDSHEILFQSMMLQQGIRYSIAGAVKDISGTDLSCNWCQVYVSAEEPVEGTDYTPNADRYLTFDSWEGDGAYTGAGIDGTFEDDANRYGHDSTFVLVPGPMGNEFEIFFEIKIGSCGPSYDWLFDNLSLAYVGPPLSIEEDDETTVISEKLALNQNYPNPFNPSTTISFRLAKIENVKLTIYDITGRKVRTLLNNRMNQGNHLIVWNGRGDNNEAMASGIYFYSLSVDDRTVTKRMTLLK